MDNLFGDMLKQAKKVQEEMERARMHRGGRGPDVRNRRDGTRGMPAVHNAVGLENPGNRSLGDRSAWIRVRCLLPARDGASAAA